jgi:sugar lactone lactonase YvrE
VNGSDVYIADTVNNRVLHYTGTSTTADRVYGQGGSFTTNTANNGGISANSLSFPTGVAVDAGGVYIADRYNHRVLYYPGTSTTATRVYGQGGSFTSNTPNNGGLSTSSLSYPSQIATNGTDVYIADLVNSRVLHFTGTSTTADRVYSSMQVTFLQPSGVYLFGSSLYITDNGNHRVLRYTGSSTVADRVFGQCGDFTMNIANNTCSNKDLLVNISDMFIDPNGGLYIPDQRRNRVVYYSGITSYVPLRVYGQGGSLTTMTINKGGISANSLNNPYHVVVDKDGTYIADTANNRVLYYSGTSTTATRVYGQGGAFTTGTGNKGGVSANALYWPVRLAVDASGLYVVEYPNHRVLHFPGTSTTPDRVYGQPSFTSNTYNNGGVSATSLYNPNGIAVDDSGVYIADSNNHRILYYPGTSTTATRVYGQGGSFTTNTVPAITASGLNSVAGLSLDSTGLYVADKGNNRILFFPASTTTATQVWGQNGVFTTNTRNLGGISAPALYNPLGIFINRTGMYIADSYNNRVLRY